MTQRSSVLFEAPYRVTTLHEAIPTLVAGEALVRTRFSAISPGTEMLVYRGLLPDEMALDATIAGLANSPTQYPLRYGYACVGDVLAVGSGVDISWLGKQVFAFHPHSSHFASPVDALLPLPANLDRERALFYPNMETAITFLLDGAPMIGEDVCVVGAGVVGLLTTALLARFPLASLTVIDPIAVRRNLALHLGATRAIAPQEALPELAARADLTFELSGNPDALNLAIQSTGFAGRVVIGSWYGQKRAAIDLGGYFHRSRIRLIGSQVSTLPADKLGRWDRVRRTDVTWDMLRQIDPGPFISHRFAIQQAAEAYAQIDKCAAETMQVIIEYQEE